MAISLAAAGCGASTAGNRVGAGGGASVPTIETVVPAGAERMAFGVDSIEGMRAVADGAPAARSALPFPAAFPASAGAPLHVFVSERDAYPPGESEVVAEYG